MDKDEIMEDGSFFEMGGDSLKAMKLQWYIQDELGVEVDISKIYEEFSIKTPKFNTNMIISKLFYFQGGVMV